MNDFYNHLWNFPGYIEIRINPHHLNEGQSVLSWLDGFGKGIGGTRKVVIQDRDKLAGMINYDRIIFIRCHVDNAALTKMMEARGHHTDLFFPPVVREIFHFDLDKAIIEVAEFRAELQLEVDRRLYEAYNISPQIIDMEVAESKVNPGLMMVDIEEPILVRASEDQNMSIHDAHFYLNQFDPAFQTLLIQSNIRDIFFKERMVVGIDREGNRIFPKITGDPLYY